MRLDRTGMRRNIAGLAIAALVGSAMPVVAAPADAGKRAIAIELNSLAPSPAGCRVTLVVENKLGTELGDMALELALFDGSGRVSRFLVARTGRLAVEKSRVRQFDVPDIRCDAIGRVLINDVTDCAGTGVSAPACLDALTVSSRAGIPLDL